MSWADLDDARRWWPESATVPDEALGELLDASTDRLTAYAPALAEGDPVPAAYRMANVYDARDLYAGRLLTGHADAQLLADGFAVTRRRGPTSQVRELLRPARPAVAR